MLSLLTSLGFSILPSGQAGPWHLLSLFDFCLLLYQNAPGLSLCVSGVVTNFSLGMLSGQKGSHGAVGFVG